MEDLYDVLSPEVFIDLISQYDLYIQYANEENLYSDGWRPVCIQEFYDNEYMEGLRYE